MTAPVVHVIDDDAQMVKALARLFRTEGYEVRTYGSAGDFLLAPPDQDAGCIVLDVHMPGPSGLELQEALQRRSSPMPIVFLTGRGDVGSGVRAMKAGAVDFLTKPVAPAILLAAVRTALERNHNLRQSRTRISHLEQAFATLTPRERLVFQHVVSGQLNKRIAHEIGIAERTVKMHRAHVMEKMRAGSVAELVDMAHELRKDAASSRPAPSGNGETR